MLYTIKYKCFIYSIYVIYHTVYYILIIYICFMYVYIYYFFDGTLYLTSMLTLNYRPSAQRCNSTVLITTKTEETNFRVIDP